MKLSHFFIGSFILLISSFNLKEEKSVSNFSFRAGEAFEYKVKFGFLTVGEALVDVSPHIFHINSRPCFKINILGKTSGLTNIFRIRNEYRSYLDTNTITPHRFLMSLRENNYKKDQVVTFEQNKRLIVREEDKDSKQFKAPEEIYDVVSAYFFLRTINFNAYKPGEIFSKNVFFDDEIYDLKVKYAGKGKVKTKFGKIDVLKLNPILPPNKMFDGEDAIRIWVSDDKNHVPILIEVDFKIGSVSMELKSFQNNKHKFDWY